MTEGDVKSTEIYGTSSVSKLAYVVTSIEEDSQKGFDNIGSKSAAVSASIKQIDKWSNNNSSILTNVSEIFFFYELDLQ